MSNKKQTTDPIFEGRIIHGFEHQKFNSMLGEILTVLDATGMPETQSKAVKDIIKGKIWALWEHPQYSYTYVSENGGEFILQ